MCSFNTFTWYQSQHTANKNLYQNVLQVQKIEDSGKMDFPKEFILTPYNYFAWKEKIFINLRTKGFYRLTLNTYKKPTSTIEKSKYLNQINEAFIKFAVLFLLISFFTYLPVRLPMKPGPYWKGSLENNLR